MTSQEGPALRGPRFSEEAAELAERRLAALRQAYPAWEIVCVTDLSVPVWYATLRATVTQRQRQAGVREAFMRFSTEALASELSVQVEAPHRTRARHTFTAPEQPRRHGPLRVSSYRTPASGGADDQGPLAGHTRPDGAPGPAPSYAGRGGAPVRRGGGTVHITQPGMSVSRETRTRARTPQPERRGPREPHVKPSA